MTKWRDADKCSMRIPLHGRAALAVVCVVLLPETSAAQLYETVGTRAQGMAGAFVAVSDDASATWWNPAGIAGGALLGLSVEHSQFQVPAGQVADGPAWKSDANTFFSLTVPSLGLSYYRLRISEIRPVISATDAAQGGRENEEVVGGVAALRSMVLNQFGATFGQSLGAHFVVASTLRLIRGGVANGLRLEPSTGDEALDEAADLSPDESEFRGDLDIGVMVSAGGLKLGASVKHVGEPDFGEGLTAFELKRQARVGAAWTVGQQGPMTATFAYDADVLTVPTALGDVRHMAGGAEAWFLNRRLGLRGGFSADTAGDLETATSFGVSVAPAARFYIDGAMTIGSDESLEGWAASFRVTF
jgi:hypothetical protein